MEDKSAVLVSGFLINVKDVKKEVNRFDEKTGKPCTKEEPDGQVLFIDGIEISRRGPGDERFLPGEEVDGLEIKDNQNGSEWARSDIETWIGVNVVKVDRMEGEFKEVVNLEVPGNVERFAMKFGLKPRWFLALV